MLRAEWSRVVLLCAAFWTVVLVFARSRPGRDASLRMLLGLAAGALLAHLGWALLHPARVAAQPWLLVDATRGHAILFVPLGILLGAPGRSQPAARAFFLARALSALVPGLAVARLGCLAAGCCGGRLAAGGDPPLLIALAELASSLGGGAPRHPAPLYETSLLVVLASLLMHAPASLRPGMAIGGIGGARLLAEPWRAAEPLEPLVPAALLATLWLTLGLWLLAARAHDARPGRGARDARSAQHSPPAGPGLGNFS